VGFFGGFALSRVDVGDGVVLPVRGEGPPVVLLHGHPRTHTTWHRVAPTLVLWSSRDDLAELHGDPRTSWADRTTDLRGGGAIDSGHHMAEDAPDEPAAALVPFLAM
jgi:hypothetical protein